MARLLALTQASLVESITDILVVASVIFIRMMRWFTTLAPFNVANVIVGTAIQSSKEKSLRAKTCTLTRQKQQQQNYMDEFTVWPSG